MQAILTMDLVGAYSNPKTQERMRHLAYRLDRLAASNAPRRPSIRHDRRLRMGLVPDAVMRVLSASGEPMRAGDIHVEVEDLIGQPVSTSSVKNWLAKEILSTHPRVVRLERGRYRVSN